jgi:hypothetical protein
MLLIIVLGFGFASALSQNDTELTESVWRLDLANDVGE